LPRLFWKEATVYFTEVGLCGPKVSRYAQMSDFVCSVVGLLPEIRMCEWADMFIIG